MSNVASHNRLTIVILICAIVAMLLGSCTTESTNPGDKIAPPQIFSIQYWPYPVNEGDTVTFQCNANSESHETIAYKWSCPSGGLLDTVGYKVRWLAQLSRDQKYMIYVTVSDRWHSSSDSDSVAVNPHGTPKITSVTHSPSGVAIGDTVTVTCVASDTSGLTLRYYWTCSSTGLISDTGASIRWKAPSSALNRYTKFVVIASNGFRSDTRTDSVLVRPRGAIPPSIDSMRTDVPIAEVSGTVGVNVYVRDTDTPVSNLSYSWSVSGGTVGTVGSTVNGQRMIWNLPTVAGTYICRIAVSDSANSSSPVRDSVYMSVVPTGSVNRKPVIIRLFATPQSIYILDTTVVECYAIDPNRDSIRYTWDTDMRGIQQTMSVPYLMRWIAPGAAGDYVIRCTASDGLLDTTAQIYVTVQARQNIVYYANFSSDEVRNQWIYAGMMSGLGGNSGPQSIVWDQTRQAMAVTGRSNWGCFAFKKVSTTLNDATISADVMVTNVEFNYVGLLPIFVDERHWVYFGFDWVRGSVFVVSDIGRQDGSLDWMGVGPYYPPTGTTFSLNTYYNLKVVKTGSQITCYLNNQQMFLVNVQNGISTNASFGVAVNGTMNTGAAFFDNFVVTNP